jgi:uncharacterized cupredoxin-like copper-binding protein
MQATARRPSRAPVVVVIAFFTIAVALVLIGAQWSLDRAPPITVSKPGTADAPRSVTVIMRDYLYEPDPLVLVPGETVRFTIFDSGLVGHEFALGDEAMQTAWASADAAATPPALLATAPPASVPPGTGGLRVVVASGQQVVRDYVVPSSGQLQLMCHLPGHLERGMQVQVQLQPAPA